jgi:glycosyltransferase involved in cell wall biosynthesis
VIAEAVVCGVPILCSRILGNAGMLGTDYRGYFTPRNHSELREKLRIAEGEPRVTDFLRRHILRLQSRFSPETERASWRRLLAEL